MTRHFHILKFVFPLWGLGGFFGHAQVDSAVYFRVGKIVEAAKQAHAPDKRTKLLEIARADVAGNSYLIRTTEKPAEQQLLADFADIDAEISVQLLPDASVGTKTHGIVNLSVANLRTQPSHAAEMATQLLLGMSVDILQREAGHYRVRTPEGYIAWVPASSLVAMDETEFGLWTAAEKIIHVDEFGHAHARPDAGGDRVSDLVYGNILAVAGEENGDYRVLYPDKRVAYLPKERAMPLREWQETRRPTAENILKSAKSMLGLPYLWGGTSVRAVDCSGFTKTAFFMNGRLIPRDASQQVLEGDTVDILDSERNFDPQKALQNLRPADLLFFASGKDARPDARVTHVALYIGNGEFIHAAGTVRINSMLKEAENYDDFQARTVVAARRYDLVGN